MKSRGCLTLQSADPRMPPTIDYAHYQHADDVASGVEGIHLVQAFVEALQPLRCNTCPQVLLKLLPELAAYSPGHFPGVLPLFPKEEDAAMWLQNTACSCWHTHGTCRKGDVVDSEHRVKGVGALRIMDASVLRNSPGTNPMATIMAVGRNLGLRMRKEKAEKKA